MDDSTRYFIKLSYDGSAYHGWQRQKHDRSVQQVIEDKLSLLTGKEQIVIGCGRTDTGVHASEFYAHTDIESDRYDIDTLRFKLNNMLDQDIAIHSIRQMQPDAHTRYDATARTYQYYFYREKTPFKRNHALIYPFRELDFELMHTYLAELKNYSDFKPLSKFNPDLKTTLCDLMDARLEELEDGGYRVTVKANRFLRNMVRRIVGTMLQVGAGQMSLEEFREVMNEKTNFRVIKAAAPEGLFLVRVEYPYPVD